MKSVVFTFGRMNSPTYGHKKLIDKVVSVAKKNGAEHRIYLSQGHDSSKNPIPYGKKVDFVRKLFPYANIMDDTKAKTAFHVCKILSDQGYKDVTLVVGDDRVQSFRTEINKYVVRASDPKFDKNKHFDFEKFTVVSAGRRDPNATGVEAASGTKMREFAKNNDIDSFMAATPTKNVSLARSIYNSVKKNLRENMQPDIDDPETEIFYEDSMYDLETTNIIEGVNDPGIFKAIFMVGGPGSGKDFILGKIIKGAPLVEINSDTAFEILSKKEGISLIMTGTTDRKRDEVRGRAKNITASKQALALQGRLGIILNGTGGDRSKMVYMKKKLEDLGYDTMMVVVNTSDEISRERNIERGKLGGREVPEAIRKQKWNEAQENIYYYSSVFGRNFYVVDNSSDLRYVSKETKSQIEAAFNKMHKAVRKFVASRPTAKAAKDWIAQELEARNITDYRPTKSAKFGSKNESINENQALIDQMRKAYSDIERMDPDSPIYKKLTNILNSMGQKDLAMLAAAKIPWISSLATNRLKKKP